MSNIKKYSYSEILSFYSPCDPPEYFQNNSPIFTPQSQEPVTLSNFKPNLNFTPKPFNFVPKKAQSSDSSNESSQNSTQTSKIIDFRPQILKNEKNKNNGSDDIEINANYSNQINKFKFHPESIGKPSSSSAPPVTTSDSKQNNNQNQIVGNVLNFKPQKDISNQEVKKIETQNDVNETKTINTNTPVFRPQKEEKKIETQNDVNETKTINTNTPVFRPQKEEKKIETQIDNSKLNNIEEENKKESQSKDNKKATPWANIAVPLKKDEPTEKVNSVQVQLQKEIDNSLISPTNNQKVRANAGFAPKKLDQTYEAPELPADKPSNSKQSRKTLTNFDEIEKEEINQNQKRNQQEPQQQQQQQKKGLFETLLEQEKKNQSKNVKKETDEDDEPPKKSNTQKVGFAPKPTTQFYEGPSIDELNRQNNASSNAKEAKSGFSALMEQEKISSEKEKREKEKEKQNNNVKKPSIVDILIAETMQEKSKEKPQPKEEDIPEEKPSFQAFKPIRAQESYEAPSLEEIENYSKKPQKKTTFSDALSNQNQSENKNKNSKPSFEELQKNESSKQAQAKKQGSFTNAPSFFDLLVKEEKEKEIQSVKNNDDNKEEQKPIQQATTGFNPKRNRPDTGSFSEMLNKEKRKQKENQSKNNTPTTVNVNVRTGSKFTGNYPSFAQLINDEARLEEQRSTFIPKANSASLSSKNTSFQQKVADEALQADATTIGDFVSVQGEMPKNWANKRGRGKKRGGRGGNTRTEETEDLFWGTPANFDFAENDKENDVDQTEQNQPSVQAQIETEETTTFGFEKARPSQKKDSRISWLANVLEEELGEENPWEFAESLVNKSKPEMIRFLSTITFDQQQASNIAARFFQIYPAK